MNLDELAEKGRRYKVLGGEISELEDERKRLSEEIIAELDRRKVAESVSRGPLTITRSSRRTGYDVEKLRAVVRPGVFRAATVLCVDGKALEQQVKAGKVTAEAAAEAERRSRPFPKVTIQEAA